MCERMKVPVPRAHSSPSESTIRASATNTRRLPEIQRPSARASPVAHRLGEMEVEGGGQQEAVADQAVGGIESGIVEHLEIERAVRRAGGVEAVGRDGEADLAPPGLGQGQTRIRTAG